MQILILDKHPTNDARINRHIHLLMEKGNEVFRQNFNHSDREKEIPYSSLFGEKGKKIMISRTKNALLNSLILNFSFLSKTLLRRSIDALNDIGINKDIPLIIHVHDPALLVIAVKLKKYELKKAKIVYDRHEVYEKCWTFFGIPLPQIPRLYEIFTKNSIDAIVSISSEYNDSIRKSFPISEITVVQNYPDLTNYNYGIINNKIQSFDEKSKINMVYIGSLDNKYDRDIDFLLMIADFVLTRYENVFFYIGGHCQDANLKVKILNLSEKFGNRFRYLGFIPRDEVIRICESSHIGFFLLKPDSTYWVKCSPNKVFEYFNCGVIPIIRAEIDEVSELNECSLYFSRNMDQSKIIEVIGKLIENPKRMKKMMEFSRQAGLKFSFSEIGNNYLDLYNTVLSKNR